jgi:thiamine-phosphate pyrophosphorylase
MRHLLQGLYAITPDSRSGPSALVQAVEQALNGGTRLVQYRDKSADRPRRLDEAKALRALCAAHGVPLLINDDVELAATVDADGVHLGRNDGSIITARRRLGKQRLVGVSCYNELMLARQAADAGADYVAFGSFFPSPTKPQAVRANLDLLRQARSELAIPAVAIGGISPENGAALTDAGADMLAVISAVFGAADITAAARSFAHCFNHPEETTR